MKTTYQALAWAICALVALQAASHAWFSAGAAKYLAEGGVLDLTAEGPLPFVEAWGIVFHTLAGTYAIPALAVILLLVGYFSRLSRAAALALLVLALVALQVTLGLTAPSLPLLALFHGLNALLIFSAALMAVYRVGSRDVTETPEQSQIPREPRARKRTEGRKTAGSGV